MLLQTIFVYSAVLLFIAYVIPLLLKYLKLCYIINRLPGPSPYILIGNLSDIVGAPEQVFIKQRKLASKYNIYRLWLSYLYVVCVNLPQDIEIIISKTSNMEKSLGYKPVIPWLNEGLLTSSGGKWRARRKMLTPAFHFNILQQFIPIFHHHASVMMEELKCLEKQGPIDVGPHLVNYTLRSICEATMGIRFDLDDKAQEDYKQAIQEMGKLLVYRCTYPWLLVDFIYSLTPYSQWKQKSIVKTLHHVSETVLKKRNDNYKYIESQNDSDCEIKKKLTMLDLLLSLKVNDGVIDDDGIREEVDTFIFAGHETTSISLGFTLMLLANHQEIQRNVYEEIMEVLGSSTAPPSFHDLQNLTYLEMCIKESLRLYPSVPFIARVASQDIVTATGYKIPKHTQIVVQIYDLHRNPELYPNPEKFDPERFLPDNATRRHPFAYLPFSGGPRNCIGQKFAMFEMKTFISCLLRNYILEAVDTPESLVLSQDMVLRTKNGIRIKIKPRISESK